MPLRYLNLRLNHIGSEGGKCLLQSLTAPCLNLENLILAGCGIKYIETELKDMLLKNNTLRCFDLSNNHLAEVKQYLFVFLLLIVVCLFIECGRRHFKRFGEKLLINKTRFTHVRLIVGNKTCCYGSARKKQKKYK